MGYNIAPGSLQELQMQMALIDHINKGAEENLMSGGPGGRWVDAQQQKAQTNAGSQLDSFLKMSQQYPTMGTTPQVQQAGNTLMGNKFQQVASNFGYKPQGQSPLIPQMSPWLNQTQAKIKGTGMEKEAEYASQIKLLDSLGITDPLQRQKSLYKLMGLETTKVGELDATQYSDLNNDLARALSNVDALSKKYGETPEQVKEGISQELITKYGAKQASMIRKALNLKNASSFQDDILAALMAK